MELLLGSATMFLVVFGVMGAGASPSVSDGSNPWDPASAPVHVKSRMHQTTTQIPAFPEEDPRLVDLKNWPKTRTCKGRLCQLKVITAYIDGKEPPPRPGFDRQISAYYLCKPRWWWGKVEMLGPAYTWTSYGQLLERGFRFSGHDWLVYQVDRAGRLFGFEDWKHGTMEYFDVDGALIAGEYGGASFEKSMREYERGRMSFWKGERVTHPEFVRRRVKLFREVRWRY